MPRCLYNSVLPLILLTGGVAVGLPVGGQAIAQSQGLAQVTPSRISGRLDSSSASSEGSYASTTSIVVENAANTSVSRCRPLGAVLTAPMVAVLPRDS